MTGKNRKPSSHENHGALTFTVTRVSPQQQVLSFREGVRSCLHAVVLFSLDAFSGSAGVILFMCLLCSIFFLPRKPVMLANNRWGYFSLASIGSRSLQKSPGGV